MNNSCRIAASAQTKKHEAHLEFSYDQGKRAEVAPRGVFFIRFRINVFVDGIPIDSLFP
jgi:hypothetical protein